jgi:radical SAM superfamily enzyme YgiQ (UPF0313 family)
MNVILFSESFGKEKLHRNPQAVLPSIYRIATHLRSNNHNVKTLPIWRSSLDVFKKVVEKHITDNVQVVGISTTLLYSIPFSQDEVSDFYEKIKFIKKHQPKCKIIVGGSVVESTVFYQIKSIFPYVDYFIKGNGEETIDAILRKIEFKSPLLTSNIDPVVCSDETYPHNTFNTSRIEYLENDYINKQDALGIELSRGCIFKCSYCNYPKIGKRPGDFIKESSTLREELIKNYEQYGIKYYYFTDDLLNESVEKMEELAELSSNLPFRLQYTAYIRLDLIHKWPIMADLLKESGLITGVAGIETINDASGKSVRKGLGINRINETLDICNTSWGGSTTITGSFILGLPHDTPDTAFQFKEWVDSQLVSQTISDIYISALRLVNSDMHDSKHNYTWNEDNVCGWVNKNGYSFESAEADSKDILKHFYKRYQVPAFFGGFDVPQVFAYAEHNGMLEEVKNFYKSRTAFNSVKSARDWYNLVEQWYLIRSSEFFNCII